MVCLLNNGSCLRITNVSYQGIVAVTLNTEHNAYFYSSMKKCWNKKSNIYQRNCKHSPYVIYGHYFWPRWHLCKWYLRTRTQTTTLSVYLCINSNCTHFQWIALPELHFNYFDSVCIWWILITRSWIHET